MRILFVCMGNICRSPTAEGVFRHLARERGLQVEVDSAGTHGYHIDQPPDRRAMEAALRRSFDLSALRARQVQREDFEVFDLILAMDRSNYEALLELTPPVHRHRVKLFMEFAPELGVDEVPDPYYGNVQGFEAVLDLLEAASAGLLDELERRHSEAS